MEVLLEIVLWIIGSKVLEFIGACFKWMYYTMRASIQGRPLPLFKDVMSSDRLPRRERKLYGGLSNGIVGFIVFVLIIALFVILSVISNGSSFQRGIRADGNKQRTISLAAFPFDDAVLQCWRGDEVGRSPVSRIGSER